MDKNINYPAGIRNLLRFEILSQYEEYEFSLESKNQVKVANFIYDLYSYSDTDFKTLFDIELKRGIYLLFNADILTAVFYRFEGDCFFKLLEAIDNCLPAEEKMKRHKWALHFCVKRAIYKLSKNEVLYLLSDKKNNITGLGFYTTDFYKNLGTEQLDNKLLHPRDFFNQVEDIENLGLT